jgi:glutamate---cysteine ligase / carboxylate-amine ligase
VGAQGLDLVAAPVWAGAKAVTCSEARARFDAAPDFTVGIEEEIMLVDPETLELAPVIDEVLARVGPDARFTRELRKAQLEMVTRVCESVAEATDELAASRRLLVERLDGSVRLVSAGTHPFSTNWGEITDGERYRQIADEYTWAARRSLACGLHVHVAVPGADRALAVYNALRAYLPDLAALAANSPFFEGRDSGLCTIRPKLNEAFPRAGTPPAFRSWDELIAFVDWGRAGGLFPDASHFWWDLRPHLDYGTLELRVADSQTRLEHAGAVAAVFQALVVQLAERHAAGEELPVCDSYRINENAWRAYRYGVRGSLVDLARGAPRPVRERLGALFDELEPTAARLGSTRHLADARVLLAGNGCEQQRYVAEREGMRGLVAWLAQETERSADTW